MKYTLTVSKHTHTYPLYAIVGQAIKAKDLRPNVDALINLLANDVKDLDWISVEWNVCNSREIILECSIGGAQYDLIIRPDFDEGFTPEWLWAGDGPKPAKQPDLAQMKVVDILDLNIDRDWRI